MVGIFNRGSPQTEQKAAFYLMALSTNDEARVREYLLGQLSDEEQLKIEERLMIEDDLFEELEISKGELVEDYCSGDLNEKERKWFEQHFLASSEGKQKYTFAMALECLEQPQPQPTLVPSAGLLSRMAARVTPAMGSVAVLLVVGLAIVSYRGLQPPTVLSLDLPGSAPTRSGGSQPPPLVHIAGVDQLKISLLLPALAPAAKSYQAKLLNSNDTGDGTDIQIVSHDATKVIVVIPAKELPPGEYDLKLVAIKSDGSKQPITDNYFFNVE
jgi:hypothetical protein